MHRLSTRLGLLLLVVALLLTACERPALPPTSVDPGTADTTAAADDALAWVVYSDIETLQAAMAEGRLSAVTLTRFHLARIAAIDDAGPELNAVLFLAPDALEQAAALDAERAAGTVRGPLHGIPVLLKGNIDVAGLPNTAGSLALADNLIDSDAFMVAELRAAGAVILGTANLSEWANFRSTHSTSGWSSIGRQTRNPYVLDRNPCGSSSGSAVAVSAGLTVVAVGTETDGSVVCPAGINGVVGIKPTLGLVSRDGIIPIAHSQDTAGPMGRSVRDAAILLQVMAAFDAGDAAAEQQPEPDYLVALGDGRLDGVRLGVQRDHFGAGRYPAIEDCLAEAVFAFAALGAEVVDPAELGGHDELDSLGDDEGTVLFTEFGPDLAAYLAAHGAPGGMRGLDDLIGFNAAHADTVMPYFGQEDFERAAAAGGLADEDYIEALARAKRVSQGAIDGALQTQDLDAIIGPTNGPAWTTDLVNGDRYSLSTSQLPAVSGYPSITVPMCQVHGLPVGLSIFGTAYSEPELLRIAYAFEQATQARRAPEFLPTLELE
jgi:amidase